jgi:hypothetical protein
MFSAALTITSPELAAAERTLALLPWPSVAAAAERRLLQSARIVASLGCDVQPAQLQQALQGSSTSCSSSSSEAAEQRALQVVEAVLRASPGAYAAAAVPSRRESAIAAAAASGEFYDDSSDYAVQFDAANGCADDTTAAAAAQPGAVLVQLARLLGATEEPALDAVYLRVAQQALLLADRPAAVAAVSAVLVELTRRSKAQRRSAADATAAATAATAGGAVVVLPESAVALLTELATGHDAAALSKSDAAAARDLCAQALTLCSVGQLSTLTELWLAASQPAAAQATTTIAAATTAVDTTDQCQTAVREAVTACSGAATARADKLLLEEAAALLQQRRSSDRSASSSETLALAVGHLLAVSDPCAALACLQALSAEAAAEAVELEHVNGSTAANTADTTSQQQQQQQQFGAAAALQLHERERSEVIAEGALVETLHRRGFSLNGARRACIATDNAGLEPALAWCFAHSSDAGFDHPLPPPKYAVGTAAGAAAAAAQRAAAEAERPQQRAAAARRRLRDARRAYAALELLSRATVLTNNSNSSSSSTLSAYTADMPQLLQRGAAAGAALLKQLDSSSSSSSGAANNEERAVLEALCSCLEVAPTEGIVGGLEEGGHLEQQLMVALPGVDVQRLRSDADYQRGALQQLFRVHTAQSSQVSLAACYNMPIYIQSVSMHTL